MRQTTIVKKEEVKKEWFLLDAKNVPLGRLAAKAAAILRGKEKVDFTPHVDMGDNIVVINARHVLLTGNKETQKLYHSYSGHPGGLKTRNAATLRAKKPLDMVEIAIKGMLPKNVLGRQQFRNLFVYADDKHLQEAQKPMKIKVGN